MPTDLNQRAKVIVDLATGEIELDEKDEAREGQDALQVGRQAHDSRHGRGVERVTRGR